MNATELRAAIDAHAGHFLCRPINRSDDAKTIPFRHLVTPPAGIDGVPDVGRLREFCAAIGSVTFYRDEESGDAARYLAPPGLWSELDEEFSAWIDDLGDEERGDYLPAWIDARIVVGATPHSGNYILVAGNGPEAGRVHEFDHDGFEFREVAADIIEYAAKMLEPDGARLTDFASHMRFITDDPMRQWWILEMTDNRGRCVSTVG